MEINFPYVNAYGSIDKLFEAIRQASVPPKFTNNFLSTMLGLKSSSHRALVPFLKKLGFINQDNVPTDIYKRYRDQNESKIVMAEAIRSAYADLFTSDEYAYKLSSDKLKEKIKTITGISEKGSTLNAISNSFSELVKLADFDREISASKPTPTPEAKQEDTVKPKGGDSNNSTRFGISYMINLNLPATTDIEVFNAIFKSLKENLLND